MISGYKRGQLRHRLMDTINRVETYVQKQTFDPFLENLNPNKLYREFFGIPPGDPKSPVTMTIACTSVFTELKLEHGVKLDLAKDGRFYLPISQNARLCINNLTHFFAVPGIAESANLWGGKEPKSITLERTYHDKTPALLVERGTQILQNHLTEEEIESIFRVLSLRESIDCADMLDTYMGRCRSLGGLYKKLPVLNSIVNPGNLFGSIQHVTMTRQTPDPPEQLVTRLNLLATLLAAKRTAGGES